MGDVDDDDKLVTALFARKDRRTTDERFSNFGQQERIANTSKVTSRCRRVQQNTRREGSGRSTTCRAIDLSNCFAAQRKTLRQRDDGGLDRVEDFFSPPECTTDVAPECTAVDLFNNTKEVHVVFSGESVTLESSEREDQNFLAHHRRLTFYDVDDEEVGDYQRSSESTPSAGNKGHTTWVGQDASVQVTLKKGLQLQLDVNKSEIAGDEFEKELMVLPYSDDIQSESSELPDGSRSLEKEERTAEASEYENEGEEPEIMVDSELLHDGSGSPVEGDMQVRDGLNALAKDYASVASKYSKSLSMQSSPPAEDSESLSPSSPRRKLSMRVSGQFHESPHSTASPRDEETNVDSSSHMIVPAAVSEGSLAEDDWSGSIPYASLVGDYNHKDAATTPMPLYLMLSHAPLSINSSSTALVSTGTSMTPHPSMTESSQSGLSAKRELQSDRTPLSLNVVRRNHLHDGGTPAPLPILGVATTPDGSLLPEQPLTAPGVPTPYPTAPAQRPQRPPSKLSSSHSPVLGCSDEERLSDAKCPFHKAALHSATSSGVSLTLLPPQATPLPSPPSPSIGLFSPSHRSPLQKQPSVSSVDVPMLPTPHPSESLPPVRHSHDDHMISRSLPVQTPPPKTVPSSHQPQISSHGKEVSHALPLETPPPVTEPFSQQHHISPYGKGESHALPVQIPLLVTVPSSQQSHLSPYGKGESHALPVQIPLVTVPSFQQTHISPYGKEESRALPVQIPPSVAVPSPHQPPISSYGKEGTHEAMSSSLQSPSPLRKPPSPRHSNASSLLQADSGCQQSAVNLGTDGEASLMDFHGVEGDDDDDDADASNPFHFEAEVESEDGDGDSVNGGAPVLVEDRNVDQVEPLVEAPASNVLVISKKRRTKKEASAVVHSVLCTVERDDGARKSMRKKMAPLRYWKNEKVVYDRPQGSEVPIVVDVYTLPSSAQSLRHRAHIKLKRSAGNVLNSSNSSRLALTFPSDSTMNALALNSAEDAAGHLTLREQGEEDSKKEPSLPAGRPVRSKKKQKNDPPHQNHSKVTAAIQSEQKMAKKKGSMAKLPVKKAVKGQKEEPSDSTKVQTLSASELPKAQESKGDPDPELSKQDSSAKPKPPSHAKQKKKPAPEARDKDKGKGQAAESSPALSSLDSADSQSQSGPRSSKGRSLMKRKRPISIESEDEERTLVGPPAFDEQLQPSKVLGSNPPPPSAASSNKLRKSSSKPSASSQEMLPSISASLPGRSSKGWIGGNRRESRL
mmetsp:Transcript_44127/g.71845  ORF Transcript_44127/g.71845 Transcript_44127/m.71845 type:complete len:1250 (-) Transcript_44127:122-3871(-)